MAIFESKYVRLKDERDNVAKAKEALELQDVSVNVVSWTIAQKSFSHLNYLCFLNM